MTLELDNFLEEEVTSVIQPPSEAETPKINYSLEVAVNAPYDIEMFEYGLHRVNTELYVIFERIQNGNVSPSDASQIWVLEDRKTRLESKLLELQPYKDIMAASIARSNIATEQIATPTQLTPPSTDGHIEQSEVPIVEPDISVLNPTTDVAAEVEQTVEPEPLKSKRIKFDLEQLSRAVHGYLKSQVSNPEFNPYNEFLREPLGREVTSSDRVAYMDKIEERVRQLGKEEGLELYRFDPTPSQRPKGLKAGLKYSPIQSGGIPLKDIPDDASNVRPDEGLDTYVEDPKYVIIESAYTHYKDVFTEIAYKVGDLNMITIRALLNQNKLQHVTKQELARLGIGREVSLDWTLTPQEFAVVYKMRKAGLEFDDAFYELYCEFLGVEKEQADDSKSRLNGNGHNGKEPHITNLPSTRRNRSNGNNTANGDDRVSSYQSKGSTKPQSQNNHKKK